MKQTANASQEYLRNAVLTASPAQLQVMLLDGAVRFALKGRQALADGDYEASFNSLDRAQRICLQLSAGLNRDVNPEVADQMTALYNYCYMRLVDANIRRELNALDDAIRILKHQRETWTLIVKKIAKEATVSEDGRPSSSSSGSRNGDSRSSGGEGERVSALNLEG